MRDIKFRIWDGAKNEWLASSNKDALPYYGFALVGEVMTVQSPPVWSLDEGNVIEQYTGLKDKNSTEIYEGDIIKVEGDAEIYRVEWIYSGFGLEPRYNSPLYPILGNVKLRKKIEVIGNVHENPELVEEK